MKALYIKPILYFLIFILMGCESPQPGSTDELPNILWITTEDITPMLGTYGDPVAHTPRLDLLAENGIQFNRAYSTAPVCAPARSCLVTGMYATSMGTQNLRSDFNIPERIRTVPHLLREKGYYCTNNYKQDYNFIDSTIWNESSHEAHWRNRPEGAPFYSVFNLETTHQSQIFGNDSVFHERYGRLLTDGERQDPDEIMLPPYYFDSPMVRKLWARYYDLVTIMDRQVKEILDQLEEDGLMDNTIVFFFSDHGTGMPRAKRALYNSGTLVPLIIYVPEKYRELTGYEAGSEVNDLVSFVDFPPTLLSLADIDPPAYMKGKPFMAQNLRSERVYAYAASDRVDEAFEISRSVKSSRFSYIRNFLPHMPLIQPNYYSDQSEIMKEMYRLKAITEMNAAQQSMWQPRRDPEELYDLESDPHEINNLAGDPAYKDQLTGMRQQLTDWMIKTHDTGLMPEVYMKKHTNGVTAYELSRNTEKYPLGEILGLNEILLNAPIDEAGLRNYLNHDHELLRYWAAVWLQYIRSPEKETLERLNQALSDASTYVQLAAADALCANGNCSEKAQQIILNGLRSEEDMVVLMAARIYELNRDQATGIRNEVFEIKKALDQSTKGKWKGYDLYADWALIEAFK